MTLWFMLILSMLRFGLSDRDFVTLLVFDTLVSTTVCLM